MSIRILSAFLLLPLVSSAQQPTGLKSRTDLPAATPQPVEHTPGAPWIVPVGTKIPIQLRQPVSTKSAQPGDPIYAQTAFPIVIQGAMVIPAGTWVQGAVDTVKRAGRIKGVASLQFHLTQLIYPTGYTLDIAAAIARVPGDTGSSIQEPGIIQHDSEKGKDLQRVGDAASKAGQIGALAGAAASPSIRGFGVGGLAGVAAGTLIGILIRGTDVNFETGTSVEIALNQAMAIDPEKVAHSVAP
jgi:hypothetical protein